MQTKTMPIDDLDVFLEEMFGRPSPPREEILRHKWIESEKAGYDIGIKAAAYDWRTRYYARWKALQDSADHVACNCADQRKLEVLSAWVLLPLAAMYLGLSVLQWCGTDYTEYLSDRVPTKVQVWLAKI